MHIESAFMENLSSKMHWQTQSTRELMMILMLLRNNRKKQRIWVIWFLGIGNRMSWIDPGVFGHISGCQSGSLSSCSQVGTTTEVADKSFQWADWPRRASSCVCLRLNRIILLFPCHWIFSTGEHFDPWVHLLPNAVVILLRIIVGSLPQNVKRFETTVVVI